MVITCMGVYKSTQYFELGNKDTLLKSIKYGFNMFWEFQLKKKKKTHPDNVAIYKVLTFFFQTKIRIGTLLLDSKR